jgi:hypothetical protein
MFVSTFAQSNCSSLRLGEFTKFPRNAIGWFGIAYDTTKSVVGAVTVALNIGSTPPSNC